jgi:hypothetical protein
MKKTIYLIALGLLVVPFTSNAQGIGIGLKAGANFANQDIKNVSTESITDFHVGGYVNIMFSESFGLTPELLYTAHGSKIDNAELSTDYVAIPLMLRWKPVSLISIEAGPQFSFLTKGEQDGVDIKDQLKNNDFGLAVGAGVHLPLGLNGGLRYVWGFTNISDVSGDEVKNRTFQVYVGWTLFGQN